MKFNNLFGKRSQGAGLGAGRSCLPSEIISEKERAAIKQSYSIYSGNAPWQLSCGGGLSLASGICSELARLTLSESRLDFGDSRAGRFIHSSLSGFISSLKTYTEFALATGGVMLKPYSNRGSLGIEVLLPDSFMPLAVDSNGRICSCAFLSRVSSNGKYYTKVEEHIKKGNGYLITNKLFVSNDGFDRGRECRLSEIKEWAELSPSVTIKNVSSPLFTYFKIPLGNSDAPHSPLGVPIFRRAEALIKQAELQYGRLLWEFEGGELAVDASEDAFRIGKNGKPELPLGKERLYRMNTLDACSSTGELIQTYAPALRDKSLINGLNRIVMFVEDACGIARGTFSDPCEVARTATEVISMRQRTASTVQMIRDALASSLEELTLACCSLMALYKPYFGKASLTVSFGDSVITTTEGKRESEREDAKLGLISPEEYRARWYRRENETE